MIRRRKTTRGAGAPVRRVAAVAAAVCVAGASFAGAGTATASTLPSPGPATAPNAAHSVRLVALSADPYYESIGQPYSAVVSETGRIGQFATEAEARAAAADFTVESSGSGYSLRTSDGGCLLAGGGPSLTFGLALSKRSAETCDMSGMEKYRTVSVDSHGILRFPGLGLSRVALSEWTGTEEVFGVNTLSVVASVFPGLGDQLEAAAA